LPSARNVENLCRTEPFARARCYVYQCLDILHFHLLARFCIQRRQRINRVLKQRAKDFTGVLPSTAWANELIPRLSAGFRSPTQNTPPLPIAWETAPVDEATRMAESLAGPAVQVESAELVRRIRALTGASAWLSTVVSSVEMARRAHGVRFWTQPELVALCGKKASAHRAYSYSSERGIRVMTIQAAKNRQFRDVVVLWGPGVPGDANHQRRLLYNAISRAEHSCTVMVRAQQQLQQPPFA
jgi:hypothetical protein